MANPFEVATVNPIQALLQGQAAYDSSNKRYAAEQKQQALQSATQKWQAGDKQGALQTLLGGGNFDAATAFGAVDQRDYSRGRDTTLDARHTEERAQDVGLRDRSLKLQESANARANEDSYSVQQVKDANGNTSFVKVNKRSGDVAPTGPQTTPAAPNNPFSAGGKFNGDQGKAAGFTDRMLQSEGILSGIDGQGGVQEQGANVTQAGLSKIPVVGNYNISADRQKYNQAKSDFINAQLRRESGAAIGQSEFDNADKQYFPVPGDKPEVIKQKSANRRAAIEAMGREGGQSYKPKYTFGPNGLTPYQAQGAAKATQGITQEQYAALPSGASFTAPDGSQRVKP